MLLDHNHKPSCKFAEDTIAYLYGEINDADKLRFEKHLADCHSCTDDLAGFSMVRSSVQEWHTEEFLPLATPIIEIPFEQKTEVYNLVAEPNTSRSWFAQISAAFKFSNAWVSAATGLAAILVCVGLIFIIINSQRPIDDRVASNKNESNIKIISSPTVENKIPETSTARNDNREKQQNVSETRENTTERSDSPVNPNSPIKISANPGSIKQGNAKTPKISPSSNENKSVNKTNNKSVNKKTRPTLSNEEDEEETLRLSDIFEEISLR